MLSLYTDRSFVVISKLKFIRQLTVVSHVWLILLIISSHIVVNIVTCYARIIQVRSLVSYRTRVIAPFST